MWSETDSLYWRRQIEEAYGVTGAVSRLDGELDTNLAVYDGGRLHSVFKIMRPDCDAGLVGMQVDALDHLATVAPDLLVPRVCAVRTAAPAPSSMTRQAVRGSPG